MSLFNKILIANRGEIAARIIRSAHKLGIKTVAIYSTADKNSMYVDMSDEAYCIGGVDLQDSYLNIDKILNIAMMANVQAIHPGYGFMSENAEFANKCKKAGFVFIGPDAETIKFMGNKIEARRFAKSINIPLTEGVIGSIDELKKSARTMQFPLLVKAAAGGGGKGMRIVRSLDDLDEAIESTSREAKAYFGDESIFIERYIDSPRHIEIQIIGDNYGNVVHLYERECSIQRRYQKIIEESPSPTLTQEERERMGEAAVRIAKEVNYKNAGTIEFLVDEKLNFYFLEMNTRVQVEHPVTEMVTGIDIVEEQILIAAGQQLSFQQSDVKQVGHAVECRIYAEDPENNFLPAPGKMNYYHEPNGNNIRVDSAINKASMVESFYDPMISKLIVYGDNREAALNKMGDALKQFIIHGIKTNISYLIYLIAQNDFIKNKISTHYCELKSEDAFAAISSEKEKVEDFIPLISFLVYSLNADKCGNIWQKVGFWREIMKFTIILGEKECEIEVLSNSNNKYSILFNKKVYGVVLLKADSGKVLIQINNYQYETFISGNKNGENWLSFNGHLFSMSRNDILPIEKDFGEYNAEGDGGGIIVSPMPGKIIKLSKSEGDIVKKGETLLIVESMKMENNILAPYDGLLIKFNVKEGDMVDGSIMLVEFEKDEE